MARFQVLALSFFLGFGALGCGASQSGGSTTPVEPTAAPADDTAAANPCAAPAGGAADPALIAQGAKIFEDSCSSCHGQSGEGHGKTPAVKGTGTLAKFASDADLFSYTKEKMPKDDPGSLSDDDVRAVVAFMRAN